MIPSQVTKTPMIITNLFAVGSTLILSASAQVISNGGFDGQSNYSQGSLWRFHLQPHSSGSLADWTEIDTNNAYVEPSSEMKSY